MPKSPFDNISNKTAHTVIDLNKKLKGDSGAIVAYMALLAFANLKLTYKEMAEAVGIPERTFYRHMRTLSLVKEIDLDFLVGDRPNLHS